MAELMHEARPVLLDLGGGGALVRPHLRCPARLNRHA
ncbi:hypothetical protein ACFMQL_19885 [Nonomuraea fastidiosa]